jgi:hypothetical protein
MVTKEGPITIEMPTNTALIDGDGATRWRRWSNEVEEMEGEVVWLRKIEAIRDASVHRSAVASWTHDAPANPPPMFHPSLIRWRWRHVPLLAWDFERLHVS